MDTITEPIIRVLVSDHVDRVALYVREGAQQGQYVLLSPEEASAVADGLNQASGRLRDANGETGS